jgi:hypothetical protein
MLMAFSGQLKEFQRLMRISAPFVAMATVLIATNPAHADWYYPLVRVTCVPEAKYAAVETLGLYNIANAVTPVPPALAAQGIHELRRLVDNNFVCELPQGTLVIEIFNYHAARANGACGGVEDADLRILLAGSEIALVKSTHGGCDGSQRHDIQVSEYELQHCILRFKQGTQIVLPGDFTPVVTKCKNTPLP